MFIMGVGFIRSISHIFWGGSCQCWTWLDTENSGLAPGRRLLLGVRETSRDLGGLVRNGGKHWRLKGLKHTACLLIKPFPELWSLGGANWLKSYNKHWVASIVLSVRSGNKKARDTFCLSEAYDTDEKTSLLDQTTRDQYKKELFF